MHRTFRLTAVLLFAAVAARSQSQGSTFGEPVEHLIVLNKAEATASLYDPATRKEVALLPVGNGPHEVAVSPDGTFAVVCNYGDQKPGNTLTVIDVPHHLVLRTIELRGDEVGSDGEKKNVAWLRPHGIAFWRDNRHVVVTSEALHRLLVVDIAAGSMLAPVGVVERALRTSQTSLHMIALAVDGKRAFGTSPRDGTLGMFTLDGSAAEATVLKAAPGAEGLAVDPRSGEVWVANRENDTLSIVAADGSKVLHELTTTKLPFRIAFTLDGEFALVTCAEAGEVQAWSAVDKRLAHTVALLGDKTENSPLPVGIAVQPGGKFAWVACGRGEWLAVIDLQTWSVVDRVPARKGPDGMAFSSVGSPR